MPLLCQASTNKLSENLPPVSIELKKAETDYGNKIAKLRQTIKAHENKTMKAKTSKSHITALISYIMVEVQL